MRCPPPQRPRLPWHRWPRRRRARRPGRRWRRQREAWRKVAAWGFGGFWGHEIWKKMRNLARIGLSAWKMTLNEEEFFIFISTWRFTGKQNLVFMDLIVKLRSTHRNPWLSLIDPVSGPFAGPRRYLMLCRQPVYPFSIHHLPLCFWNLFSHVFSVFLRKVFLGRFVFALTGRHPLSQKKCLSEPIFNPQTSE